MKRKPAHQTSTLNDNIGPVKETAGTLVAPDTTVGSLLHRLPASIGKAYVAGVAFTYIPLFAAALLSPLPLATQGPSLRLPFLYDLNVAFMFVVSFPALLALTVSDQSVLASSLQRVCQEGTVSIPGDAALPLMSVWARKFRTVNRVAQAVGIGTGFALAVLNYLTYTPRTVGFWIAEQDRLLPVGAVFLWCIFLFYALIPIYILRSVFVSIFLRKLVACSQISMLPFHPDRAGGLRPVGRLGLRNQYALTVFGLNVVLLVFVSLRYLKVPASLYGLIAAAAIAYVILGPIVFIGPLLPFRGGMLRTKTELGTEVAQRLRVELRRLRGELTAGKVTKEDEELIERLRRVGAVIEELPVWPFDSGTFRKFLTAYAIPLLSLVQPAVATIVKWYRS